MIKSPVPSAEAQISRSDFLPSDLNPRAPSPSRPPLKALRAVDALPWVVDAVQDTEHPTESLTKTSERRRK